MRNIFEQLIKKAKGISLSSREKLRVRQDLHTFMREHPLEMRQSWFTNFMSHTRVGVSATFAVMLIGVGASYAAEGTLPGDALYPIKVSINETVRGFIQISDESQAEWETRLATRRLEEAESLAREGRLDAVIETQIANRFNKHATLVETRIETLEANGSISAAIDLSSRFETSLKVHERILGELSVGAPASPGAARDVQTNVRKSVDAITNIRVNAEASLPTAPSASASIEARQSIRAAEIKIEEVVKFLANSKKRIGVRATNQAKTQLGIATSTLANANIKLKSEIYNEAIILAHKSVRIADEAKLLIKAKQDFDVNVEVRGLDLRKMPSAMPRTDVPPGANTFLESELGR
jgi:hypothetical protein